MIATDRTNSRRYQIVKVFVVAGQPAKYQEAKTGRRYNLVKRYI